MNAYEAKEEGRGREGRGRGGKRGGAEEEGGGIDLKENGSPN